ncbi:hypothetical protein [Lacunisphaera limnophila]|nr:hypothetical protein [Lacunisphaera limnophila]
MARKSEYPRTIIVGSAIVKIYRVKHRRGHDGYLYTVAYKTPSGDRKTPQFADPAEAEKEARLRASQIAKGHAESVEMTKSDREEWLAIKRTAGDTPPLAAIREWAKARELCGDQLLAAAKAWHGVGGSFTPILAEKAVDEFIAAVEATGKQGEATYRAKLKPIATAFAGRELHSITAPEWTAYLARWTDGVSQNDHRKRTIALCRWAQRNGYIPKLSELEVGYTLKAKENMPEIGIITPEALGQLLVYIDTNHPRHLPALVLAAMAGLRAAEIHGSRKDRNLRQLWADIHLNPERVGGRAEKPFVRVTHAKPNTPAWRHVPLCPAARSWLEPYWNSRKPSASSLPAAMERVRDIAITLGLDLPDNCFRHSYITYQVSLTGSKAQVALWAGTSEVRIDRHYRRPVTEAAAKGWFGMTREAAMKLPKLSAPEADYSAMGKVGGSVISEAKKAAARKRLAGEAALVDGE